MDKQREELSLPSYMQVKGAKRASSAMRGPKRGQQAGRPTAAQRSPEKISLEEFAASAAPKAKSGQDSASRKAAPQASKPKPAQRSGQGSAPKGSAPAPRQVVRGEMRTSPAPMQRAGQKSASSRRAFSSGSAPSGAAPSGAAPSGAAPIRAPRAASVATLPQGAARSGRRSSGPLDMTSSRLANQPRRAEEKKQRKKGSGVSKARLLLVALVAAGLFWGIHALATALPKTAEAGSVDVGATVKLPKGVSILGIDVSGQTKSAARGAVSEAAEAQLAAAQVTLKLGEETYNITGKDIGLSCDIEGVLQKALEYEAPKEDAGAEAIDVTGSEPGEFSNIFTYDQAALTGAVEAIAAKFDIEPVNAMGEPTMNAVDHTVTFHAQEGKAGRALDVEATVQKIQTMLGRGIYTAQIDGVYATVEPAITGAMLAQEIGVRGSFTTRYPTIGKTSKDTPVIENRVFNIHKAAEIINACMVAPGEEWSFNSFVGPRTVAGGWKEANGIAYGKEYTLQAGGGICQVSTTLYLALLQSKVTVTDRRAHSIPSDYVDHGLDATVDYATNLDLKFKNDTGAPLYLFAYFDDVEGRHLQTITFVIYGKPLEKDVSYKVRNEITNKKARTDVKYVEDPTIPRGYKVITLESRPSYTADVYLDKYIGAGKVDSEFLYTDKYAGNAEEAKLGTGSPKYHEAPPGAVAVN